VPESCQGLEIGGKRRKLSEVDPAFTRAVKVRAARRVKTIPARDVSVLAILVRRMAAGHHFDGVAAKLNELVEERREFDRREVIAAGMRDDRLAARLPDPFQRVRQLRPAVADESRLALAEIAREDIRSRLREAFFHQIPGEMRARDHFRIVYVAQCAFVAIRDADLRERLADRLAARRPAVARGGEAVEQLLVLRVDVQADDVYRAPRPRHRDFHAREIAHAERLGRFARFLLAAELVVIG
jgi:hypothetical protein